MRIDNLNIQMCTAPCTIFYLGLYCSSTNNQHGMYSSVGTSYEGRFGLGPPSGGLFGINVGWRRSE